MTQLVQVRVDAPCGTITLNRPACHNALSHAMIEELAIAWADLLQEKRVRSVILTGAGNSFCSGTDLQELHESYQEENAFLLWHQQVTAYKELIELMLQYPKPTIAAVHGAVIGMGLALALACDRIIAGQSTFFRLPEANLGLNAGVTIPLLALKSNRAVASNLLFFDQKIDAATAMKFNLVDELVVDDLLWVKSLEAGKQSARGARESHQMSKRMLNESIGEPLLTLLNVAAADMASARTTDVAREGVAAFLEKREPNWEKPVN